MSENEREIEREGERAAVKSSTRFGDEEFSVFFTMICGKGGAMA